LESAREKQYLRPLFQEVYDKAKAENPELEPIDLYIIDSMTVTPFDRNIFALIILKFDGILVGSIELIHCLIS